VSSTDIDFVGLSGINRTMVDTEGKLVQALTIAAEALFEQGDVQSP
jgi:hypothetical protein